MKVAVQKLAKLVQIEEVKATSVEVKPQNTPKAIQTLFTTLMESVRPFLKKNETR